MWHIIRYNQLQKAQGTYYIVWFSVWTDEKKNGRVKGEGDGVCLYVLIYEVLQESAVLATIGGENGAMCSVSDDIGSVP